MRLFACGVVVMLAGCIHDQLVTCGDVTCPSGDTCDQERSICVGANGLSIPPAVIDFGAVGCATQATHALEIRNFNSIPVPFTVTSTLTAEVTSGITDVSAIPTSGEIPANGSISLQVIAAVTRMAVPGTAAEGKLLVVGTDTTAIDVQLVPTGAVVTSSVQDLDFGEFSTNAMISRTVEFSNTGTVAADLTPATTAPFSTSGSSVHLDPGATAVPVEVDFMPEQLLAFTAQLDPNLAPDSVVCQTPPGSVELTGAATSDDLIADHLTLDFGVAACGAPAATLAVVITNTGASDQVLDATATGALYSATAGGPIAGNGGTQTFIVTRAAIANTAVPMMTPYAGTLSIMENAAPNTQKMIALQQTITAPVLSFDVTHLDFGIVAKGSYTTLVSNLRNTGTGTANVTASPASTNVPGGGSITISPTTFQISAGGYVPVLVTLHAGTTDVGLDDIPFSFTAPGQCGNPAMLGVTAFIN
jgi:HYDIN/CFA65/VesB-like, Ig-like domain